MGHWRATITRRFGDALLLQRRSLTARAVTSSVNFYLCTINRKLRETLRIVKKKDRDGELLC